MANTDESPHHSAKQVRNDAGQWVSGDSFDGKLAALRTHLARSYPVASLEASAAKVGFDQASRTVSDTGRSLTKMGNAFRSMFGEKFAPEDAIPSQSDAGLAGLAMTGGGFGSLTSKAVSGRALEDVAASNGLRSSPVEAGSKLAPPKTIEDLNTLINDPNGPFPQVPWTDADEAKWGSHGRKPSDTLHANPKEAAPLGLALSQDHPLSRFAQGRAGLKELQGQTDAAKARLVDVLQNVQAYKPGMTAEDVTSAIDALKSGQTDAIEPQLRNLLQAHKAPEALDAYRNMENARASAIDNTVAKWPFANDEKLAVNPKEAAPVGMVAAQTAPIDNQGTNSQPDQFEAALAQLNGLLSGLTRNSSNIDAVVQPPNQGHAGNAMRNYSNQPKASP